MDHETQDQEFQRRQARERQRRADDDLRWLMSGPRGRRIIWQQLERCRIYRLSFSSGANATGFNEGKRAIGLALLNDLMRVCPDKFYLMSQEHADERIDGDRRHNDN